MNKTIELMLNPIRSAKQGTQINIGKFDAEYDAIVTELSMHPEDMASIGAADGDRVLVLTEVGRPSSSATRPTCRWGWRSSPTARRPVS